MSQEATVATTGLRERKKAARRSAFVTAARALVLERGLDQVTVEDICERVGVSPRTFFNYFESKQDAILGLELESAAVSLIPAELRETFAGGGPTGVLLDDLMVLVAAILDDPVRGPRRLECVLELVEQEPRLLAREVHAMEQLRSGIEGLLERRERACPAGVSPVVTTALLMATVRAATQAWTDDDQRGEPADYLPAIRNQLRRLFLLAATDDRSSQKDMQ